MEKKDEKEKIEKKRFSRCEMLIAVLLVVLAGMAIVPPAGNAETGREFKDLIDRLHEARCLIERYKACHEGLMPGQKYAGEQITGDEFVEAMVKFAADDSGVNMEGFFVNEFAEDRELGRMVTVVNDAEAVCGGDEKTGWWFNTATGKFHACDCRFHINY